VVAERLAPAPFSDTEIPAPPGLVATLTGQLDLEPLDVPAGLTVFRNEAAIPLRSEIPSSVALPPDADPADALRTDLSEAAPAMTDEDGHLRWSGALSADHTMVLSAASSDRWELDVDGGSDRTEPFGWATGFEVGQGGDATLRFRTPIWRYAAIAGQALVWLWLLRRLTRARFERADNGEVAS
jgi:hypothetical protein